MCLYALESCFKAVKCLWVTCKRRFKTNESSFSAVKGLWVTKLRAYISLSLACERMNFSSSHVREQNCPWVTFWDYEYSRVTVLRVQMALSQFRTHNFPWVLVLNTYFSESRFRAYNCLWVMLLNLQTPDSCFWPYRYPSLFFLCKCFRLTLLST